MDQTLINTGGAGVRALDRAFRKILSVDNAMEGVPRHGRTDTSIVRHALTARVGEDAATPDVLETIIEAYLSFLREEVELSETYRVLPGIVEILRELSGRADAMVGLATGNVEMGARIKLDRGGLNSYFAFGGFGSDSEKRPELVRRAADRACRSFGSDIDPQDIFVIGDTPLDIEAALDAGFRAVGVATGDYNVDELRESGAECAISDFAEGRYLFSAFIE